MLSGDLSDVEMVLPMMANIVAKMAFCVVVSHNRV